MTEQFFRERIAKLQAHNDLLKSQLEVQKTIAPPDSKTAAVLGDIIKWFDNVPPPIDKLLEGPRTPNLGSRVLRDEGNSTPRSTSSVRSKSPLRRTSETQTDALRNTATWQWKAFNEISPLSLSDLKPPEPIPGMSPDMYKPHFPERILGEVAFQLDRRILSYVFNGQTPSDGVLPNQWRQRFYGITLQHIADAIETESQRGGVVNQSVRMCLTYRRAHVMRTLARLGYDVRRHAQFSVQLVNTHGLLLAEDRQLQRFGLQDPEVVRQQSDKLLLSMRVNDDPEDFTILLNCLVYMATEDGKPLFIF